MYTCPVCGDKFGVVETGKKAQAQLEARDVYLTAVHRHDEEPVWWAIVLEKGERKGEFAKQVYAAHLEAKKAARLKDADEKREKRNTDKPLAWAIDPTKTYLGEEK
jgi:hypothetical protein